MKEELLQTKEKGAGDKMENLHRSKESLGSPNTLERRSKRYSHTVPRLWFLNEYCLISGLSFIVNLSGKIQSKSRTQGCLIVHRKGPRNRNLWNGILSTVL